MSVEFTQRPLLEEGSPSWSLDLSSISWTMYQEFRQHSSSIDNVITATRPHSENGETAGTYNYRSTQGWDNPNIADLQRENRLLPPTPFVQQTTVGAIAGAFDIEYHEYDPSIPLANHSGSYHTDKDQWLSCSGSFLPSGFTSTHNSELTDFGDLEAIADTLNAVTQVQAAAAKIYSSGFDALTSASEFHKVVSLFLGLKKRILRELRSGRLYNLWLEGRYAWRTLIFDLIELEDAVVNFSKARNLYTEVAFGRINSSETVTGSLVGSGLPGTAYTSLWMNGASPGYKLRYDQQSTYSLKGTVSAFIQPSQFRANPFETAWELVPYSFVIDWFVDFGKWIRAISFDATATEFVAAEGIKLDISRSYEAVEHQFTNRSFWIEDDHPGFTLSGEITSTFVERRPTDSISKIPQYNPRLSVLKVADLIALMLQGKRR